MSHPIPGTTGQTLSPTQIYQLAIQAGFSVTDAVIATAIALAESGGRTNIANDSTNAAGIWQLYTGSLASQTLAYQQQMTDPLTNARAAYAKFIGSQKAGQTGWCPWASYDEGTCAGQAGRNNSWRTFLSQAQASATGVDIAGGGGSLVVPGGSQPAGGSSSVTPDASSTSVVQTGAQSGSARELPVLHTPFGDIGFPVGLAWAALFGLGAIALILIGVYLYFRPQINQAAGKVAAAAA